MAMRPGSMDFQGSGTMGEPEGGCPVGTAYDAMEARRCVKCPKDTVQVSKKGFGTEKSVNACVPPSKWWSQCSKGSSRHECGPCPADNFIEKKRGYGGILPMFLKHLSLEEFYTCRPCPVDRATGKKKSTYGKLNAEFPECYPADQAYCRMGYGINEDGKTCHTCPKDTYSYGGKSPKCSKCPVHRPYTNGKTGVSNHECKIKCPAGTGASSVDHRAESCVSCAKGTYRSAIEGTGLICQPCKQHVVLDSANKRIGCEARCPDGYEANGLECVPCQIDYVSKKGAKCTRCPKNQTTDGPGSSECIISKDVSDKLNELRVSFEDQLNALKETSEQVQDRTTRLWQDRNTRAAYNKMTSTLTGRNEKMETERCEVERQKGMAVFSSTPISTEKDETTCILKNREEMMKGFCNFRAQLENFFGMNGISNAPEKARSFFPNMCCKEHDSNLKLKVCESAGVPREEIVPFASSQGGELSDKNVYGEVARALSVDGHIHRGLKEVLSFLEKTIKGTNANVAQEIRKDVDKLFGSISLCGPRTFSSPNADEEEMCEMFLPYKHVFTGLLLKWAELSASKDIKLLLRKQESGSTTARRLLSSAMQQRSSPIATNPVNIAHALAKKSPPSSAAAKNTCPAYTTANALSKEERKTFCPGYAHLDLSIDSPVVNFAMVYLQDDIGNALGDGEFLSLKDSFRYQISDSCPTKMFGAEDITIQNIAVDTFSGKKEWVALVKLNSKSKEGYLQHNMKQCMQENGALPGVDITTKVMVAVNDQGGLMPMKDKHGKRLVYKITVKGQVYERKFSKMRSKKIKKLASRQGRKLLARGGACGS